MTLVQALYVLQIPVVERLKYLHESFDSHFPSQCSRSHPLLHSFFRSCFLSHVCLLVAKSNFTNPEPFLAGGLAGGSVVRVVGDLVGWGVGGFVGRDVGVFVGAGVERLVGRSVGGSVT